MASRIGPRSVKDATRFTSTIPHATSKSAGHAGSAVAPKAPRLPNETPEQRVRRLRLAHLAAQKAQVSGTDRVIDATRRFANVAHKFTITGIVVFTAVAGVVSIYSVWDMLRYNRSRRAEWLEAQKRLEVDELSAARLAYLKGEATDAQVQLVDDANRDAEAKGIRLPPLLSAPEHRTHFEEHVQSVFTSEQAAKEQLKREGKGMLGIFSGLFGGQEKTEAASPPETSLGLQGVNGEASALSVQSSARDAWDTEKENQRRGGSLDQLGLDTGSQLVSGKKGWRPW